MTPTKLKSGAAKAGVRGNQHPAVLSPYIVRLICCGMSCWVEQYGHRKEGVGVGSSLGSGDGIDLHPTSNIGWSDPLQLWLLTSLDPVGSDWEAMINDHNPICLERRRNQTCLA